MEPRQRGCRGEEGIGGMSRVYQAALENEVRYQRAERLQGGQAEDGLKGKVMESRQGGMSWCEGMGGMSRVSQAALESGKMRLYIRGQKGYTVAWFRMYE